MRFRDKYFPYPVIKPVEEDFTQSIFNIDISINEDEIVNELVVNCNVYLDNKEIEKEVNKGNLSYVVHIEESETMFRKAYYFNQKKYEIRIPLDDIRSVIEVMSFITVVEPIEQFQTNDLDDIYTGIDIFYDKGNIVGIGSPKRVDITKEDDEIEGVSSIFLVVPDEKIKEVFEMSMDRDRITIKISQKSFELYKNLLGIYKATNNQNNKILLTLMVLPAFVEALNILKVDYSLYENDIWFDSLVDAYKKKSIDLIAGFKEESFDSYRNAQIIFEDVINESLINLYKIETEVKED